jgi:penicillin-binding protein 1C
LFDAFVRSGLTLSPLSRPPKGVIFAGNSKLPPPLQRFNAGNGLREVAARPHIMFPPDGARLELAASGPPNPVALKISGGRAPLIVMMNGVPLAADGASRTLFFQPDGPGFVRLTVLDAAGATDSVTVRLQ